MKVNVLGRIILLFLFLSACGSDEAIQLKEKISDLELELENCKNGPSSIFNKFNYAFIKKDYDSTKYYFNQLELTYPGSEYLVIGKSNYDSTLVYLEDKRLKNLLEIKVRNQEKLNSLKNLQKIELDATGLMHFRNTNLDQFDKSSSVSIYIVQNRVKNQLGIRMIVSYYGSNRIFFNEAILNYDQLSLELPFQRFWDKKTKNNKYNVWEWIDISIDSEQIQFLREFVRSENATIMLSGKTIINRQISTLEKQGIIEVLNAFDQLMIDSD